jgi:hypothetical protein
MAREVIPWTKALSTTRPSAMMAFFVAAFDVIEL